MYLEIKGVRHTCSKRIVKNGTIKYLYVTPDVEDISGTAKLYRDDGFLLAEDNLDAYERKSMAFTSLVVTNAPEPTPIDPSTTDAYRIEALEEENKLLTQQVEALSGQIDFQEECIVEMAAIVYA